MQQANGAGDWVHVHDATEHGDFLSGGFHDDPLHHGTVGSGFDKSVPCHFATGVVSG